LERRKKMKRLFILFVVGILIYPTILFAAENSKRFDMTCRQTDIIQKAVESIEGVNFVYSTNGQYDLDVVKGELFKWEDIEPKIQKYLCLEGCIVKTKQKPAKVEIIPVKNIDNPYALIEELSKRDDIAYLEYEELRNMGGYESGGEIMIIKKGTGCISIAAFKWCSDFSKCSDCDD